MQKKQNALSRRTVTSGLAWSVPAVAAVSTAPFAAASPVVCPKVKVIGEAVKFPGNSHGGGIRQAYGFDIVVTNNTELPVRITPGTAKVNFKKFGERTGEARLYDKSPCNADATLLEAGSSLLALEPGQSTPLFYLVNNTGNSANEAGCITSTLKVEIVGAAAADTEVCDTIFLPERCFDETPPTC